MSQTCQGGRKRYIHQATFFIVEACYVVVPVLRIAKAKKLLTIAETLVKPCLLDYAKIVLADIAYNTLKQVSPSKDTIKKEIVEMCSDIKVQLISAVTSSALVQFSWMSQQRLLTCRNFSFTFAMYLTRVPRKIFLFCHILRTAAKAVEVGYCEWFLIFLKRII